MILWLYVVIKVLTEMGKTPLEDYQIIGFDGLRPAFDQPYLLSTIVQEIGSDGPSGGRIIT